MTYTKRAADVFAPVDAAGDPRQISPTEASVWGTEVEGRIGDAQTAADGAQADATAAQGGADTAQTAADAAQAAAGTAQNAADAALDAAEALLDDIADIQVDIPRISSVELVTDEVLERLTADRLQLDLLGQRVTDAGVYVEPESGRVRIAGIAALDSRVSTAEVIVDALQSEISLRATFADVNQAVSEALLDPTQIPVIGDIETRLTDAEVNISAAEGEISTLTTTLTVDGSLVTMTSVDSRLNSLEGTITQKVDSVDFTDVETRLQSAEQEISAFGDSASISQTVQATRSQYDELDEGGLATVQDLIDRSLGDTAIREATASARQEITARVDADLAAEATARLQLEADLGTTRADLIQEQTVRAAADSALASDITSLTSTLGTAQGDISGNASALSALTTRVTTAEDDITSQASDISSLQSSLTNAQGDISGNASAISSLNTRVTTAEGDITATASDVTSLTSRVGTAESDISSLETTRVTASGAIAAVNGTLNAAFNTVAQMSNRVVTAEGNITSLQSVKVNASGAVSAVESEISASYGSLSALASATSSAKATADSVEAAQFLGVVGGTSNASLELRAYDGAAGSGSSITLNADDVLVNGTLSANKLVLDGQTVGVGSGGVLEVRGAGIDRGQLANQAASDQYSKFEGQQISVSGTAQQTRFMSMVIGESDPDDAWICNFRLRINRPDGRVACHYRQMPQNGDAYQSWIQLGTFDGQNIVGYRFVSAGFVVPGGAYRTQVDMVCTSSTGTQVFFENGFISARALKR